MTRRDEDRGRLVDGSGRGERGLVAGGVVDAGRARGEDDAEGADGGVLGACALGDDERGGRARGGDRRERSARGDVRERPGCGVGARRRASPRRSPARGRPCRSQSTSCMTSVPATRIGLAPSEGEVAAKEERLPAASRIPVAFVANATVKAPTAVSGAPAPSVIVSVATAAETETEASVAAGGDVLRASTGWCRPSRPRATRRRWRGRGRPCRWCSCPA